MEDNLDKIVKENTRQFDHYQGIINSNNQSIGSLRQDLGRVQKQHFEMQNVNETLEQRIDQIKA